MSSKVSVIIAIYKVGEYLEQCIQSVIGQTYKDMEIILVDDGSPDNAPAICDYFAEQDERIKVIHKKNEGCVYARRDGLCLAQGKYALLIDGDDWMDEGFVEKLVTAAEKTGSDVVVDSFLESYEDKEIKNPGSAFNGTFTGDELKKLKEKYIYSGEYYTFGINPSFWNKLFITDKLKVFFMDAPQRVTLGEDFAVTAPYMAQASSITIIDSYSYYHYRQRPDSMANAYNSKLVTNVSNLINYLQQLDFAEKYQRQLYYYFSWLIAIVVKNQMRASGSWSERKQMLREVYTLPNVQEIVEAIEVKPIKYKVLFWCIRTRCLELLMIMYKGK